MTKITSLSCVMAAMLYLTSGIAIAEDNAEAQQAKSAATNNTENQPDPKNQSNSKEGAADTHSAQSNTTENKEPDCN